MGAMPRFSYYTKIQVSLWIFILLPLVVVSILSYGTIQNIVVDKVKNSQQSLVNVVAGDLNKYIEDIIYSANLVGNGTDSMLLEMRQFKNIRQIKSFSDYEHYTRIAQILDLAFSRTTGINPVVFMVNDAGFLTFGLNNRTDTMKSLTDWLHTYNRNSLEKPAVPSVVYWTRPVKLRADTGNDTENYRFAVKEIVDPANHDRLGTLYIGVSDEYLKALFGRAGEGRFELFGQGGTRLFRYDSGNKPVTGKSEMVSDAKIPRAGWKLVYTASSEKISSELAHLFRIFGFLLGGCILVFILLSVLFAKSLHRPLNKLRITAEKFGGGNRLVRFPVKGSDEIAVLGVAFNRMLDQIQQLIVDVEHEQEEKRMIELQALFSQIRPHFLLNTLNSIKCNLLLADDATHAKQIDALMSLLRAYMRVHEPAPLIEEIKLLQNYIEIMNMRGGMQIRLDCELEEGTGEFLVPRLLLQPLIENAIVHGFMEAGEEDHIGITTCRTGSWLIIEVEDNGSGITEESLAGVNASLSGETKETDVGSTRIGLPNIRRRLRLTFGQEAELSVRSNPDRGVTVRIQIPVSFP